MPPPRKLLPVSPKRIHLIQTPTPLHRLDQLSAHLGIDLWIKRDDLTGFALGGNKGRKLEYLMAEILDQGIQAVVTCGAAQSNFIRQLGAACSTQGIQCAAAVMAMPFDVEPPESNLNDALGGNLVLDRILGIDLRFYPNDTWETLYLHAEELAKEFEAKGYRTYRMPIGGSSPLGAYAFYQAAKELELTFDSIVFASSSGSTHTGLAYAFHSSATRVLGIACDPEPEITQDFALLARGLDEWIIDSPCLQADDYDLNFDYVGPGYGVPSQKGIEAIELVARMEGIFLDPIYSGKAFSGLLDLVSRGELQGRVLFWHTGGIPALFTHGD